VGGAPDDPAYRSSALRAAAAVGPGLDGAAAVRELMGRRFGEVSTLLNYTFQSFNFRGAVIRHVL
jgi:Mn-containing catalase